MNPARNDPCPCGSGKKFKKCCLNSAIPEGSGGSSEIAANFEPRFFSVASSYYTTAALEEAMKPDGMVPMHPYARLKCLGDPRRRATTLLGRFLRRQARWVPSTVAELPTGDIEKRLANLGVRCDRETLSATATSMGSAWSLAEARLEDDPPKSDDDRDFVGLAVCELWRRHCPDRPSIEMVDDWVCEGYASIAARRTEPGLTAWWKVWEAIRPALDGRDRNLFEAGDRLFPCMSQSLGNWAAEFRMELANAALDDPQSAERGIRFIHELIARFPDSSDAPSQQADLTRLLFALGRDTEAEECGRRLIEARPHDPRGYVALTDEWTHRGSKKPDGAPWLHRAIELLETAMQLPLKEVKTYALDRRLADARQALAKKRADSI